MTDDDFLRIVRLNLANAFLLDALPKLGLPQGMLTAGCLFQTVWNVKAGMAPDWGIKDYDVFYFDDTDLSWEAEDAVIGRVRAVVGDLADKVEVKNQARAHLWYEERFGVEYPPLAKVTDAVDRYLIGCTRVGVHVDAGSVYAPERYGDMWNGVLRMNVANEQPELFRQKCANYVARWPWLNVLD